MPGRALAVVTGASRGIGEAFADALARHGHDLVLTARSTDQLAALAQRLRAAHGVEVMTVGADLTAPGGVATVVDAAAGREVTLLVNNAGMPTHGRFERVPDGEDHRLVALNVVAVVDLCRAFLPGMVVRGRGAVVNVASLGGFQPTPFLAAYGASKAFVLSFSEALASEHAGTGVRVQALCPGPVRTAFFAGLGSTDAEVGQVLSAEAVVRASLRGLDRGTPVVVPGRLNALAAQASRVLPRRAVAALAKRAVGPGPLG